MEAKFGVAWDLNFLVYLSRISSGCVAKEEALRLYEGI